MPLMTTPAVDYKCRGVSLNQSTETFGYFRETTDCLEDGEALRSRMQGDGYLYLPGLLNTKDVLEVRNNTLEMMKADGLLHPAFPTSEGIGVPGEEIGFMPKYARSMEAIHRVLYEGPMMEFMKTFIGEEVLHFDYTWFRVMGKGKSTPPHCDIVYMGRGTKNLFTAWVPYMEIPLEVGGLMILENSHHQAEKFKKYLEMDVDTYCVNKPFGKDNDPNGWRVPGAISQNARNLQKRLGGRWLTTHYQPGDALIFSMATIHASLENQTEKVRISSDSRYQKASEPADHRWIGPNPVAHGPDGKRGLIC